MPEANVSDARAHEGRLPYRPLIAALAAIVPLGLLTCWMAVPGNSPISVPFGVSCTVISSVGIIALLRGAEHEPLVPGCESLVAATLRELALLALALTLFVFALRFAVSGTLPAPLVTAGISVPLTFLASVVATFRLARQVGWVDGERRLTRRYGFWLMLLHAATYLPLAGSFSLIDPWETHYGEVAREMLARDDWISLWWAQDGWFWSKPVLDFWLQGLSFSLLGVKFLPDQMLAGVAAGHAPHPEWAARTPVLLMTLVASYCFYKALARCVHPRAGFLAALVLSTTPYWFLIAHQTMTDMPYVAALVVSVSCFLLGIHTDPERVVRPTRFRSGTLAFDIGPGHALLAFVLLLALPQICYLVSRNLTVELATGALEIHADRFMAGSGAGNCGLPGNDACRSYIATYAAGQPALLACLWLFLALWLARDLCQETKVRALYYYGAWLALALSVMAKGAPGLVLPLAVIVIFLGATKRWTDLLELRPAALVFVFAVVALPWHIQMVLRHGHGFVDRLLLHDMYKRAFDHVHDTNDGVDVSFRYYVWQLGYGLFPWFGLCIVGVLDWLRKQLYPVRTEADSARQAATFMGLWFITAFSLFALSGTKFHHYILPAVPPLAALAGILLHDLFERSSEGAGTDRGNVALLALIAGLSVLLIGRDLLASYGERLPGEVLFMQLFTYQYKRPWPNHLDFDSTLLAFTAAAALGCLCLAPRATRRGAALSVCALATAWAAWGVNVYLVQAAPHWGQRESIAAYYRVRSPREARDAPLVAFQMNWKGENFYTGNRLAAFVRSGEPFQDFMKAQRTKGVRTLYFTTEPSRFSALKREIGAHKSFQVLTDDRVNNKFGIVKVEL